MTRRDFLARLGSGLPLVLTVPWIGPISVGGRSRTPGGEPKSPVIPPGARSLDRFLASCTGCERCITACPTRVLAPSIAEYGRRGLLQPVLDFSQGYCEYTCTRCGEVCPTGAILKIGVEEKRELQIGRVNLVKEDCIVISRGTACGACAEICPTQAVRMVPLAGALTQPLTDPAACVGCGGCELVCPARPRKAIFVSGVEPHRRAVIPAPPASSRNLEIPPTDAPRSPAPSDFPF